VFSASSGKANGSSLFSKWVSLGFWSVLSANLIHLHSSSVLE
jgi:hypothetical protein